MISDAIGVPVARLEPLDARPKTLVRDNIAGHSALRKRDLWGLEWQAADLRGSTGDLVPTTLLRIPLQDPAAPGDAWYAFDRDGRLYALGLRSEPLARDATAIWPGFLAQFQGRAAATTGELPTPVRAFQITEAAAEDPTGLTATLYAHRLLVAESAARTAQVMALTGRGEMPSAAMLRDWAARTESLAALAPRFRETLGAELAQQYARHAQAGQEILAQAAFAASSGQAGEVRRLVGGELPRTGAAACDALVGSQASAPDLYRVGHDVWAPERREETAQYLASLTKAALLLTGVLMEDGQL